MDVKITDRLSGVSKKSHAGILILVDRLAERNFVPCGHLVGCLTESATYLQDGRWDLGCLHNFCVSCARLSCKMDNPQA